MAAKVHSAFCSILPVLGFTLANPIKAQADVISTFDLSGSFSSISVPYVTIPLSGSITIDTTTGLIQSQNVFTNSPGNSAAFRQGYNNTAKSYYGYFFTVVGAPQQEMIYFNTTSLVNYAGGPLGSTTQPTLGGSVSSYNTQLLPPDIVLNRGSAMLQAVSEPNSTGLVVAAFLAMTLAGFHRAAGRRRQYTA